VVTALRRKYAELLGQDDAEAVAHVGATLLLFNPTEDLALIKPIRPYKHKRQKWMATVCGILRREGRPMTGRELTYAVMQERGVSLTDLRRLKSIECGLHATLGRLEGNGVERVDCEPKRWVLA
jgi:hypothetical protein